MEEEIMRCSFEEEIIYRYFIFMYTDDGHTFQEKFKTRKELDDYLKELNDDVDFSKCFWIDKIIKGREIIIQGNK